MEMMYLYIVPLLLAFYLFTNHFILKLRNLPPSPFPCLPLIGHLYLLKTPFHKALLEVSNRHGPLAFLRLGSRPILLVSSPSGAEECLGKNDIIFANRPLFLFGKHFGYNYTSMAWSSYGEHWRNLRRISKLEVLSSHRIHMLSHVRVEEVRILVRKLFQDCVENPNKVWDMKTILFEFTFNVVTRMIMGKRYYGDNVDNAKEAKLFQTITEETALIKDKANLLDFLPMMSWFGMRNVEKMLMQIQGRRDKFVQSLIKECRRMKDNGFSSAAAGGGGGGDEGNKKTIMEVLLALNETQPEYYTDEFIRNLMLILLQAGSDTSANSLKWAFSLLLDNPSVLKKAQSDIDNLVGQDRLIEESDVAQLPYLNYIICETLRMYPPAPLLMPHRSSKDCVVGGYHIPSETILLVNVWGIQNDPKVWEQPEKFIPERFESFEQGKDGFKFLPFGSGRRGCPGESLAYRVIGLALGSLLQCFDWERITSEATQLVAPAVQPLMATCYPRPQTAKLISDM